MERDFMGLIAKDSVVVVKEEAVEACPESAFPNGSSFQWPSSNNVSALPHFMKFKVAQEENTAKTTVNPAANRPMPVSMTNPFFKTHFASAGQNCGGVVAQSSILGTTAGTTDTRFSSKPSGPPPQLTIFYGGTVNVFDNISPEKAQAIMLLAGNGSVNFNTYQARAQSQAPPSKHVGDQEGVVAGQLNNASPSSGRSSPMSVSSHPVVLSGSGSATNDETMAAKPTVAAKVDSPALVNSVGPLSGTTMLPSAVPQFRKASLARFLEKRKERAMNSAPYNFSKISPERSSGVVAVGSP